jgi:hypothetical protein
MITRTRSVSAEMRRIFLSVGGMRSPFIQRGARDVDGWAAFTVDLGQQHDCGRI